MKFGAAKEFWSTLTLLLNEIRNGMEFNILEEC